VLTQKKKEEKGGKRAGKGKGNRYGIVLGQLTKGNREPDKKRWGGGGGGVGGGKFKGEG